MHFFLLYMQTASCKKGVAKSVECASINTWNRLYDEKVLFYLQ